MEIVEVEVKSEAIPKEGRIEMNGFDMDVKLMTNVCKGGLGLGVQFNAANTIMSILKIGPAAKERKLRVGDIVIKVDPHLPLLTTHPLPTAHTLPTTHYPPPTVHYPLPTTHYLLPTAHYPPTARYPLPTTHYSLPTTHCSLPTPSTHCSLPMPATQLPYHTSQLTTTRLTPHATCRTPHDPRLIIPH